jgi:hypothetical protein
MVGFEWALGGLWVGFGWELLPGKPRRIEKSWTKRQKISIAKLSSSIYGYVY